MPKKATVILFNFVKFAELIWITVLTCLIFAKGINFFIMITEQSEIKSKDVQCIIGVSISMVLVLYNLFYTNLMINLRFKCKLKCYTIGLCVFDCLNFIFCYRILLKPCRDQCCIKPWTIGKWIIKVGLIGLTSYLIRQKNHQWEEEAIEKFQVGSLNFNQN